MKTQIGLGVLSIPLNFDVLGMIPGVICLLIIGGITTWSDYMVGAFKMNHGEVYGIDDVGQLIAGKPGRYVMAAVFVLCKHCLGISESRAVSNTTQSGYSVQTLACSVFPLLSTRYRLMALVQLFSLRLQLLQAVPSQAFRHLVRLAGWHGSELLVSSVQVSQTKGFIRHCYLIDVFSLHPYCGSRR